MLGFEREIWISRRIKSRYSATLKLSWSFRQKHVELVEVMRQKASLCFNASYLLNTSAGTPKIKWTPREFMRPFTWRITSLQLRSLLRTNSSVSMKRLLKKKQKTKKNSKTLSLYIADHFSQVWFVAGGQTIKPFLWVETNKLFSFIFFIFIIFWVLISLTCVSSETHNPQSVFAFLFVSYTQIGSHCARCSLRRPWKLGLRIFAWSKSHMFRKG